MGHPIFAHIEDIEELVALYWVCVSQLHRRRVEIALPQTMQVKVLHSPRF